MPTELRKMPYSRDKVRYRLKGIVKSELVDHLEGKVCYNILEKAFGCGYKHSFTEGKRYSLTTKIGVESFTI
jgi:hypothetical protein